MTYGRTSCDVVRGRSPVAVGSVLAMLVAPVLLAPAATDSERLRALDGSESNPWEKYFRRAAMPLTLDLLL